MLYFFGSIILLFFFLVVAPFVVFPDRMDEYGGYLTGLAAIGAVLKYISPHLLILFYKNRYSNEIVWKAFLDTSCPKDDVSLTETDWIAGLINYFRRNEGNLHMGNPWYDKLPGLSDNIYYEFGGKSLVGKKEGKQFEEVKKIIFECAEIVSMSSTPSSPMNNKQKYEILQNKFKDFVVKSDKLNRIVIDVPIPVKKIIDDDDFFKSFFGKKITPGK